MTIFANPKRPGSSAWKYLKSHCANNGGAGSFYTRFYIFGNLFPLLFFAVAPNKQWNLPLETIKSTIQCYIIFILKSPLY